MTATLINPYSYFAVQVVAVLLAGLAVRGALARALPVAQATALAAVAALAVLLVSQVWTWAAGMDSARAGLRVPAGNSDLTRCFFDRGEEGQIAFVNWLRRQIPAQDAFAAPVTLDHACLQLNMLPRIMVETKDRPRWTVGLGELPAARRARVRRERSLPAAERTVLLFSPTQYLVRER